MTEPTEAEVDAAFQAGGKMIEAAFAAGGKPVLVREVFRAALTAAAQVREREAIPVVETSELARVLGIVKANSTQGEAVRFLYVQNWITSACRGSDGFDVGEFYEQIEKSVQNELALPHPNPAPDSGRDVLGMRKGEE